MTVKLIGAAMIVFGCGGFGFSMAAAHIREEAALSQLIRALEWMELELAANLTPLPELCRGAAAISTGSVRQFLQAFVQTLDSHTCSDPGQSPEQILSELPTGPVLSAHLKELEALLGRFDLPGQLQGLRSLRQRSELSLKEFTNNRQNRLRSYQTLGLCAGAALAILFL